MSKTSRKARERRQPDYALVLIVAALLLIGLSMVFSTTFDWGYQGEGDPYHFLKRQALWVLVGIGIAVALAVIEYDWLRRMAVPIMAVTIFLLILLLFVGEESLGARRSLLGGSVQPGELAKLTTVIYIAAWVSSKGEQIRDATYGLIPFGVLTGFTAGLIVLQPDLSTAAVIVLCSLTVYFIGGADLMQLITGAVAGLVVFCVVVLFNPYAQDRLRAFIEMLRDPSQITHHAQESLIALGSGGLFGAGLGLGRQKFGFLPVPHTDSIFAVIGEELGLVGCLLVVALFVLLAWRGFRIAMQARGEFGMVLACGLTVLLVLQAVINAGVVSGILPFTGMILPFVSLGGSSMLVSLGAVGVLLSISRGSSVERRSGARVDRGRRDGGARLSRAGRPAGS